MQPEPVTVIGGGLAGSEAAWQLARRGVPVNLYEMRPATATAVHRTGYLAELVCSNSLGADDLASAAGLLKEEMRRLGSLILTCAAQHTVPAGRALAVDRERFAREVTARIWGEPRIRLIRSEVRRLPEAGIVIVATGPLTSESLSQAIRRLAGPDDLYFYDAAAPVVTRESIDESRGFWGSRYGRGEDYFNCTLTPEEYGEFWRALCGAEVHEPHLAEELRFFEGCVPVEELARRGPDTLRFGPMRPVGLVDPRTGRRPYAVVQLRRENREGSLLNLVGFQTRLRWGEQRRVFRLVPALARAEFERYGVIHRNTFINSPRVLAPTYQLKQDPRVFFAGQITGVEGYVESAASGLLAGWNAARLAQGEPPLVLPRVTMIGALAHHITSADPHHFQPMNAAFGLLPPLEAPAGDKTARREALARRALEALAPYVPGAAVAG